MKGHVSIKTGRGIIMDTTQAQLHSLLQNTYFDNIDQGDADGAVRAFTDDIAWSHYQVWEHHGHVRNRADIFRGRNEVHAFLATRINDMQEEGIRHQVNQVIVEGNEGAFRAQVVGVTGKSIRFFGWVELTGGRISRYMVSPEP
jgi:ketosteroid isomerase-like protein